MRQTILRGCGRSHFDFQTWPSHSSEVIQLLIHDGSQGRSPKMSGYEKVAGLMTKHSEVATFQRFDFLNTLNILYLQAELVHLERELKHSMRQDLESDNRSLSEPRNEAGSFVDVPGGDIESANGLNAEAEGSLEKNPLSNIGFESSLQEFQINERVESARNWVVLAHTDKSPTWEIMLKTREKLKEYSTSSPETQHEAHFTKGF